MAIDNDTRGWIMTALSGVACMVGSLVICIDLIIRLIPNRKCRAFKVQDSNAFLSCSLSLSFGVMLFSALRNLLQNAERSLKAGGFSKKSVAWIWLGCFFAGAAGIQILARIAHHYLPHHVVDCDHTHEEEEDHQHLHSHDDDNAHKTNGTASGPKARPRLKPVNGARAQNMSWSAGQNLPADPPMVERPSQTRPRLHAQLSQKVANLITAPSPKDCCNQDGQCFGFSNPCGKNCFKKLDARTAVRVNTLGSLRQPTLSRTVSTPSDRELNATYTASVPNLTAVDEETPLITSSGNMPSGDNANVNGNGRPSSHRSDSSSGSETSSHLHHDHHHHVPENAFLSIGLQTTLAIALHKLPEGFITFATNHANPKLGFTVFLALFVHNIVEGFTMALPLFLALRSRWKAVLWSTVLGGLSQPLGAGIAAIWFHFAGKSKHGEPGDGVYGCMYAVIAGVMASVALQLFSESLDLTHNRNMCLVFAFVGMGILGISSALTA